MINHIISNCSKKENKTRHNWVGKVIHKELCKKLKFVHTNKWYMHNPESILKKLDTQASLGFWETNRSSNLGQMTRSSKSQEKKSASWIVDFAFPVDHRLKLKKREKRDNYQDLARELKELRTWRWQCTSCNSHTWYSHQRIGTGTGGFRNKRMSGDHPNYSIVEISQNTKKSPWEFRRLAVTQNPVKKPSATAGVKNPQISKIIIIFCLLIM